MSAVILGLLAGKPHWPPQLCLTPPETKGRRHHADHRMPPATEGDRLVYDFRTAAKPPLPQSVTENHYVATAGLVFFREKVAAQFRLYAEHRQKTLGDALAA